MPARSVACVQPASATAVAICALSCAPVGAEPDPAAGPLSPTASSSCSISVSASGELYPFLVMQADQAFVAVLKSGSWTTSVLMTLFIVSMPAIEVANWALLNSATMFRHLPAAACALAGRLVNDVGGGPPDRGSLLGAVKPYCTASTVPM